MKSRFTADAQRIVEVELSERERERVLAAALGRAYPAFDEFEDYTLWAEREVGAQLPIQALLRRMQVHSSPPSLLVVRNTPSDP